MLARMLLLLESCGKKQRYSAKHHSNTKGFLTRNSVEKLTLEDSMAMGQQVLCQETNVAISFSCPQHPLTSLQQ